MPYNGAGLFTRIYQWVNDEAMGLNVDATRTDTDSNDIAGGLSNAVTRDGQSPWLANMPAGGMKITGLAAGSTATDSVNYGQVFNNPTFITPRAAASPPVGDNSTLLATTAFATQLAYQAAIPGQALGLFQSNGTVSNFTKNLIFGLNFAKGADVASAASPNIWAGNGNAMHITGTTAITGFAAADQAGATRWLIFDDSVLLTNGANFIVQGGANYVTSAGDVVFVYADTTTKFNLLIFPADGQALSSIPYLKVSDTKAAGSGGGGNAVGLDPTQTRALNTVNANSITGASLATNTITLPAGTYELRARAPALGVGSHKAAFWNATDLAYTIVGSAESNVAGAGSTQTSSTISGRFTIASTKTFQVRHFTQQALTSIGLGASGGGSLLVDIYTEVEIWKVL